MNIPLIPINKGKIPPSAVDIEEAIIGALMIDTAAIDSALQVIKSPSAFYKEAHQRIFKAVLFLVAKNSPVDLLTVSHQLKKTGQLEAVGGNFKLVELSQKVSSGANVEYHSHIILQKWVQRTMIRNSSNNSELAYSPETDIFELIDTAEKQLDEINTTIDTGNKHLDFKQAIDAVVKRVELISTLDPEIEISGVTTGSRKLDKFTGGWQDGDLVISAARPGMGKTAKMLKNISEIALRGDSVGVFSLEMPTTQLAARIVSINTHFHLAMLLRDGFRGKNSEDYFTKLFVAQKDLEHLPIFIDDRATITINQLYMKARIWKRKHNIKALFIDYLQLMAADKSRGNREAEISEISRRLKQLAKELNIPVIALSQLSRAVETRPGDNRPKLIDLRESGAIEQDADIVEFIYRPGYYGLEPEPDAVAMGANTEIIFAKFRNGGISTRYMYFDANKAKFLDPEDREQNDNDDLPF